VRALIGSSNRRPMGFCDCVETDHPRPAPGALDSIDDHIDYFKVRIRNAYCGGMREQIENFAAFDAPFEACLNTFPEIGELPAARSHGAYIARRIHRHLNQTAWIDERLRGLLHGGDRFQFTRLRRERVRLHRMAWDEAADPCVAL